MAQSQILQQIITNMENVIVGKREVIELALITLLSDGHLLLEDVPGVGKTTLGKALAQSIRCSFASMPMFARYSQRYTASSSSFCDSLGTDTIFFINSAAKST